MEGGGQRRGSGEGRREYWRNVSSSRQAGSWGRQIGAYAGTSWRTLRFR
jgi:hypothetical protein